LEVEGVEGASYCVGKMTKPYVNSDSNQFLCS
jgi:hypothetical protein